MPNLNQSLFTVESESNVLSRPKRKLERSLFIPLDDEKTLFVVKVFSKSMCF
jgi:hypothetical protein